MSYVTSSHFSFPSMSDSTSEICPFSSMSTVTDLWSRCPESLLSVCVCPEISIEAEREWAFISFKKFVFCVQSQFPKNPPWGVGVGTLGQPANGAGQKAAGWDAIFSHANSGKEICLCPVTTGQPNTITPASQAGLGSATVSPSVIQKRCWLRRASRI